MKKVFTLLLASLCVAGVSAQQKAGKKPNIIIILADDMGYSDINCFGSDIETPNINAMAKGGLVMTNFYNASRCCPSRASLLTGLYQHQAGVGDMVNTRPQAAYQGYLNTNCVTIAEALKAGGYNTYMAGKWHVGTAPEHWPVKRGFDHYFGLIDGAGSYFQPTMPYRPNQHLTIALDDKPYDGIGKDWYSTDKYADYAVKYIKENKGTGKPFFLYMAFTSPHWPLMALPEDISRYKGRYINKGWDKLREERLARMKELGIVSKDTKLSPRDSNVPEWNSLTDKQKWDWDDKMAVYAAMVDRMDQNIGRIRAALRETGEDENTLIMFMSDNGASHESTNGPGFTPEVNAANAKPASEPGSFTSYGFWGANVSNTPMRMFKHWEYEGGTATPFIAYYPGMIKPHQSAQPGHIIDLMATCLDAAGVTYPKTYNGHNILPTEGISLLPLMEGKAWKGHDDLFFEHEGGRAVREGDWKLVSQYPQNKWQLYNIKEDRNELNDLADKYPDRVKAMEDKYKAWAAHAGVIPFESLPKGHGDL
ncbi:arylsulfatase [Mucilaginibacter yixingensis]|uniref:Arylsulfatase n=1 Tax=Mucilaginibacter yixingensis TaxID=1295612 RepID=A0A2T5JB46_9SPHI|nr:arylsulfatase [Mucilaginibacter yixingensis]PTQ98096.1 arylsulfatase [Mucilaginibacter yixingensis]